MKHKQDTHGRYTLASDAEALSCCAADNSSILEKSRQGVGSMVH